MTYRCCLAVSFALACLPGAFADEVEVQTGTVSGRILTDLDDAVLIKTLNGDEVAISREVILRVARRTEVEFLLDKGAFLEDKGEDEQAYLEYIEILKRDPSNQAAKKRMDDITTRHQRARWERGLSEARKLVAGERYRQALQAFQTVLAEQPEDRLAQRIVEEMCNTYAKIAYLYYNHCYDEGAINELYKAEDLNPDNPEIYYLLGRIHETDGHLDLARQEYEKALELEPTHFESRERLTVLIRKQRQQLSRARRG